MAKKNRTSYECQYCGYQSLKFLGKCPSCSEWDSFVEVLLSSSSPSTSSKNIQDVISIVDIEIEEIERYSTGDSELDLVLGGGIVKGSLILIGGSPGIGKSTLLLKVAGYLAKERNILYISGEESLSQIKLRADRLGVSEKSLYLFSEIEFEKIREKIEERDYSTLIIDSIQTIYTNSLSSAPGSVSQVRAVTFELMRIAKERGISIFVIGHITKDGAIAGPRVLEHMVDVVLYFEGEASRELRILRGFKNRFGTTSEIGLFEMGERGLVSAKNIASKFISKSQPQPGSALTVIIEGSRPLIIEVQALITESFTPNSKRSVNGFDYNRLNMLLALLERRLGLPLNRYDVFVNITGGIRIDETASDLAILASIISSFKDRPLSKETIFLGEVSLIGDIRGVPSLDIRLREAISQGIKRAIVPKKPMEQLDIALFEVDEVEKIIDWM
ncbi:MAG TPA: DNA repair protein RadA [Campylobacterales bacterium]|nr:DNA repair protein RadA [Campylobacterales bacterium]